MQNHKEFNEWNKLKQKLHNANRIPRIKEHEIWWCAVGKNVGVEINGKNKVFSRPVLVFKKFSRHSFLGIPLTSQPHDGSWYANFIFQNKVQYAVLTQIKHFSVSRLYTKIGELSESDFEQIKNSVHKLYF